MVAFSLPILASVNNLNAICNINDSNILAKHFNMGNILFLQVTFASRQWLLSTIHEWWKWAVWDELIDKLSHCISQIFPWDLSMDIPHCLQPSSFGIQVHADQGQGLEGIVMTSSFIYIEGKDTCEIQHYQQRTFRLPLVVLTLYWKYHRLSLQLFNNI